MLLYANITPLSYTFLNNRWIFLSCEEELIYWFVQVFYRHVYQTLSSYADMSNSAQNNKNL